MSIFNICFKTFLPMAKVNVSVAVMLLMTLKFTFVSYLLYIFQGPIGITVLGSPRGRSIIFSPVVGSKVCSTYT